MAAIEMSSEYGDHIFPLQKDQPNHCIHSMCCLFQLLHKLKINRWDGIYCGRSAGSQRIWWSKDSAYRPYDYGIMTTTGGYVMYNMSPNLSTNDEEA
jgi:hypothetical protein